MTQSSLPGRDADPALGASEGDSLGFGDTSAPASHSPEFGETGLRESAEEPSGPASDPEERAGSSGGGPEGEEGTGARRRRPRRRKRRPAAADPDSAELAGSATLTAAPAEEGESPLADDGEEDSDSGPRRKKRRRRGRRGGRGEGASGTRDGDSASSESAASEAARSDSAGDGDEEEPAERRETPEDEDSTEVGVEAPRKKRSRRGRRRGRGERGPDSVGSEPSEEGGAGSADEAEDGDSRDGKVSSRDSVALERSGKRRRRGSRGGRRRREDEPTAEEDELPEAVGIESIPGEEDDLAEVEPAPAAKRSRRSKAGRAAKGDVERTSAPASRAPEVPRDQRILVNARDPEETRVVVVEQGRIVDLQMNVRDQETYVNDIYRGRVVNIESAIGAAFVDFGEGRNGFLHASDVMDVYGDPNWSLDKLLTARTDPEEWGGDGSKAAELDGDGSEGRSKGGKRPRQRKRRAIDDLLKKGQTVVVQITKDAIGDKGPTLTTYISIPGRYLVLMPSLQRTGVSRKIEDDKERKRLKRILQALEIPQDMGVIVRTAGIGKTKSEIQRDLEYLIAVWQDFSKRLVLGRAPAPLYRESDVAIRTMRDLFSSRTEEVVVDDEGVFEKMREFTEKLMPEHMARVTLHQGDKPLFHHHNVEQDFERIFQRRIDLPSGGSIVIEQTEALVAIDVNSGRTRDEGADFEDIALKTNLEAAPEIARQIRLRDMGGIVVLDFIDMLRQGNRKQVERALEKALDSDRARSKVGRISQFGLLELTRQRLGPGLSKLVYDTCPTCKGSGRRRTAQSRAQAVLRRLASALTQKGFTKIDVVAHKDTVDWLKKHDREELRHLEELSKREIALVVGSDEQAEDSIFHYLRADGREVRPGGRRKR